MSMMNLYIRFLIVAVVSSVLAWATVKYLLWKYYTRSEVSLLDLLACVITASATCGFVGIVLVDTSAYAESALFYWGIPIGIGFVFGVVAGRQVFMPLEK
jgi:hypothetical protein